MTTTGKLLPGVLSRWEGSQSGEPPLASLPEQWCSWASCLRWAWLACQTISCFRVTLRPMAMGLPAVDNRPQRPNVSTLSQGTTSPTHDPGHTQEGAEVGLQTSSCPRLRSSNRLSPHVPASSLWAAQSAVPQKGGQAMLLEHGTLSLGLCGCVLNFLLQVYWLLPNQEDAFHHCLSLYAAGSHCAVPKC